MSTDTTNARWSSAGGAAMESARIDDTRIAVESPPRPAKQPHDPVVDEQVLQRESHEPDGRGMNAHERTMLPWVVGALAVFGVVGIFVLLSWTDSWQAGTLGAVWVLMGYCVAWIVVWGAGLARVFDEVRIEKEVRRERDNDQS